MSQSRIAFAGYGNKFFCTFDCGGEFFPLGQSCRDGCGEDTACAVCVFGIHPPSRQVSCVTCRPQKIDRIPLEMPTLDQDALYAKP